jgi:restriction system protein
VSGFSGVEFETHIARLLRNQGYSVRGTPVSGDQGADLVVQKDGRTIVVQAKRYVGTVGNKAIQEVIGAVSYYGASEGWVITNSTFTPQAKALAQKSNVKLFDGFDLKNNPMFSS